MLNGYCLVVANGEAKDLEAFRKMAQSASRIIAADGGLKHLQALGLKPDLLIGDLDSVTSEQLEWVKAQGCEVRKFPIEKDDTDLELALKAASKTGCQHIIITAALGGRLDQTLANIWLLTMPELEGHDVRIDDGETEVLVVRDSIVINGQAGDIVSLIPLNAEVEQVRTSGLRYPLSSETLFSYRTRGVSNEMVSHEATIEIGSGQLLCIHQRRVENDQE